jgi:hypothetical protein
MKRTLATSALVAVCALAGASSATAATEEVVESDVTRQAENTPPTDNWVIYTRAGTPPSAAVFTDGPGSPPLGVGSLTLTTVTGSEKVQAFNFDHVGTKLSDVDAIGYSTYRTAGSLQQVTALNVVIDYNGPSAAGGFSTLVFEPVYNTDQGAVVSGQWQDWVADGSGIWWSTQPIPGTNCSGATATCDQTWDEIVANNPDATVLGGVGLNQGSGNPGLNASSDAFTFDDTTYDFEADTDNDGVGNGSDNCVSTPNPGQEDVDGDGIGSACDSEELPTSKDQCKNGGWMTFTPAFKNQGQCVSSVASRNK